jgi:hypothetical protein
MSCFLNFEYSQKIKKNTKRKFFQFKNWNKKKESMSALFFESVQKSFLHSFVYNFEKRRMFPAGRKKCIFSLSFFAKKEKEKIKNQLF